MKALAGMWEKKPAKGGPSSEAGSQNRTTIAESGRQRPSCSFRHVAAVVRSQSGLLDLLPGERVEELRHVGSWPSSK